MLQVLNEELITQICIMDRAIDILRKGWCQFAAAKTAGGLSEVPTDDPNATHFCFYGALDRARHDLGLSNHYEEPYSRLLCKLGGIDPNIIGFNDTEGRKAEEVIARAQELKSRLIQA